MLFRKKENHKGNVKSLLLVGPSDGDDDDDGCVILEKTRLSHPAAKVHNCISSRLICIDTRSLCSNNGSYFIHLLKLGIKMSVSPEPLSIQGPYLSTQLLGCANENDLN